MDGSTGEPTIHIFNAAAVARQFHLLHDGHLREIPQLGLARVLYREKGRALPPTLHQAYADALADMAALLDEIRFEGGLAALYIDDYAAQLKDEPSGEKDRLRAAGIPIEVIATLPAYYAPLPAPIDLFTEPHQKMTGSRVLGLWFAGQLLDSALFRSVAVLDRLAILLWSLTRRPLASTKSGVVRYPTFRIETARKLSADLPAEEGRRFSELTEHALLRFILHARNDFTHSRRLPSQLHGHYRIVYTEADPSSSTLREALDATEHEAMLLATYNELLRPAVDLVRRCVGYLYPDMENE